MIRTLCLAACFVAPLCAQLQLLWLNGSSETPVGSLVPIGSAAKGDTLVSRFQLKNTGNGPAIFSKLEVNGYGFDKQLLVPLPYTIAPGQKAEFRVIFSPSSLGSFSASLLVNSSEVTKLLAIAIAVPTLKLAGNPLSAGQAIDFGSVVRGSTRRQTLVLSNDESTELTVDSVSVNGAGFVGPVGLTPLRLAAQQTVSFDVIFSPDTPQPASGALSIDQRAFVLTGLGLDPPLPAASIQLAAQAAASAQQNSISIPLAAAAPISATGTLTMQFRPSVAGVSDDPAIQFLTGPKRSATVTINSGDTAARFGSQSSLGFQTGTTAGTITFTLQLPNGSQQTSLTVAPAPVNFDSAHVVRRTGDLDVSITGFDNTYSASQLAFTFYDKAGATVQPGMIRVDAANDFRLYFASTQTGGAFGLLATFPVTGDVAQIGAADIQVTNSAGVAKTQRISF